MKRFAIIIAVANPQLRTRLVGLLDLQAVVTWEPRDIEDLFGLLAKRSRNEEQMCNALVLEEAFIYPHVYEECAHIKEVARQPLTILLLVEPRTRTRSDWRGVDYVLRLPMRADEIAARTIEVLRTQL